MKKKLHIVLAVVAAALVGAEALMHLWQPILPSGVFACLATAVGIGARVTQVLLTVDKITEGDDATDADDNSN